jgi:hypothetical protein
MMGSLIRAIGTVTRSVIAAADGIIIDTISRRLALHQWARRPSVGLSRSGMPNFTQT